MEPRYTEVEVVLIGGVLVVDINTEVVVAFVVVDRVVVFTVDEGANVVVTKGVVGAVEEVVDFVVNTVLGAAVVEVVNTFDVKVVNVLTKVVVVF